MQSVLVLLLMLATAAGPTLSGVPNLSGLWKLDRDMTTANLRWNKTTSLVVTQTSDEIRFDRYNGAKLFATDSFLTDGKERPRYTTRIERAYSRARWDKKNPILVITTRSFLDLEGYQSYNDIDSWSVSQDGETLTHKQFDGSVVVYMRDHSESQSIH